MQTSLNISAVTVFADTRGEMKVVVKGEMCISCEWSAYRMKCRLWEMEIKLWEVNEGVKGV